MPIEPIKKSNVSEEVFEQMKTLISTGEWKAGEKIQSENDLAKTFGVSRVSIRAALGRLNALGLVCPNKVKEPLWERQRLRHA